MKVSSPVTVSQLEEFDEVIDVRSPSEFLQDHIPGAVNRPVLDDAERARIGTLYKTSPFDAKKAGAALIARNIARHLEQDFLARPKTWRPLVYCWRGGKRSEALAHILGQIGWRAGRLEGGYKAYRRAVMGDLQTLPGRFRWRVVCGPTGSGKSRLLQALSAQGAQVLDLEQLAAHRGSVLGNLPDAPQPPQKMFESLIWGALRRFDPHHPVHVEAESKKIGSLHTPDALLAAMWAADCIRLEAGEAVRVALLKREYAHFLAAPAVLHRQLDCLAKLYGHETIAAWKELGTQGRWDELVAQLLQRHYDPAYARSTFRHYQRYGEAAILEVPAGDDAAFAALASRLSAR